MKIEEIDISKIKWISYHLNNENKIKMKNGRVHAPNDDEALAIIRQIRNLPTTRTRREGETITYIL